MLRHRLITTTHIYIKLLEDIESPAETWRPIASIDFTRAANATRDLRLVRAARRAATKRRTVAARRARRATGTGQ